jgi:hypothetical protein
MAHGMIKSSYSHLLIVILLYTIHLFKYLSNDNFGISQDSRFSEDSSIEEGSDGKFRQHSRHVQRSEYCEYRGGAIRRQSCDTVRTSIGSSEFRVYWPFFWKIPTSASARLPSGCPILKLAIYGWWTTGAIP